MQRLGTVRPLLALWIGVGVVRVLLGASTSSIAFFFFGLFWLVSGVLLIAAVRQFVTSRETEVKVEAFAICAGVVSFLVQGLLGAGDTVPVVLPVFLVSVIVLVLIYGRRLRRVSPSLR